MRDKLMELQDAYVHQTRAFGEFVASVRKHQQDVDLCLDEGRHEICRHQRTNAAIQTHLAHALDGQAHSIHLALEALEEKENDSLLPTSPVASPDSPGSPKRKLAPKSRELAVYLHALQRNIAKEMKLAAEGILLQKVIERTH